MLDRMKTILLWACLLLVHTGMGQERLTPLRTQWHKSNTTHFICYTAPNTLADSALPYIHKKLEEFRQGILTMMGEASYEPVMEVFFFDSPEIFSAYIRKQAQGISYARQQVACFVFARRFDGFTPHELTHIISITLWGGSALWMEEGLATLADEQMQSKDFHAQARELWQQGQWLEIEEVQQHFNRYNGQWRRYVVAASLLKFIQQQYGTTALQACWKAKQVAVPGVSEKDVVQAWMKMIEGA
jgi:hypothetical protein